jgi:dTDP-4-amino-4,6-dideoxygalactose transaminase
MENEKVDFLKEAVNVTRPALPPIDEFIDSLREIWDSRVLTNEGPFHQQFENELAAWLGVKYVSVFSNGTLALLIALQALRINGEVITTPYSFVATSHCLWWNNIKPVFVDIDPVTCNLDPAKIESAITPQTSAIVPVHVYGNPCDVDRIGQIADTYGLKVIYDACHTFGVKINDGSVLNFGDLSVMSFHATKVFTTFEGGAVICHDEKMKQRIDFLKNFGYADQLTVVGHGINAKMNEIQAAIGLLQLKYIDQNVKARQQITEQYRVRLRNIDGLRILEDMPAVTHCYSYFPIFIDPSKFGTDREKLYQRLKLRNVNCRRYFYPLISHFPLYRGLESASPEKLPVAEAITKQVMCLPIYPDLPLSTVDQICDMLLKTQ